MWIMFGIFTSINIFALGLFSVGIYRVVNTLIETSKTQTQALRILNDSIAERNKFLKDLDL